MLCERFEQELGDTEHRRVVEAVFQGKQRDYVRCCECGTTSHREDSFQDLKLAVPLEAASAPPGPDAAVSATQPADIQGALRELLAPEAMRGAEQYECECCGRKTDAERGVRLHTLPPVLTLQLKRFRYELRSGQRVKVNTELQFPEVLDMGPLIGAQPAPLPLSAAAGTSSVTASTTDKLPHPRSPPPPSTAPEPPLPLPEPSGEPAATGLPDPCPSAAPSLPYELYAVLVHSGSAAFGHYYALIKDLEGGRGEWHEFNDSVVKPIKPADLRRAYGGASSSGWGGGGSSAYMLLYRRCSAEPDAASDGQRTAVERSPASSTPPPHGLPTGGVPLYSESLTTDASKRLRVSPPAAPADAGPSGFDAMELDRDTSLDFSYGLADGADEEPNPYAAMEG